MYSVPGWTAGPGEVRWRDMGIRKQTPVSTSNSAVGNRAGCQGDCTSCEQSPSGLTPPRSSVLLPRIQWNIDFFLTYRGWLRQWRPGFDPWVRKIPWRNEWLPTPILLPGESHGQRSLVGYNPWGHKESDMTEQLIQHQFITFYTFWCATLYFYFYIHCSVPTTKNLVSICHHSIDPLYINHVVLPLFLPFPFPGRPLGPFHRVQNLLLTPWVQSILTDTVRHVSISCVTFCPAVWKCCIQKKEKTRKDHVQCQGVLVVELQWVVHLDSQGQKMALADESKSDIMFLLFLEVLRKPQTSWRTSLEYQWLQGRVASVKKKKSCLKPKGPLKGLLLIHKKV